MTQSIKQQVLDAFAFRSACRYYDGERKISAEDFNYILELARLSPSSMGTEPWKFLVVQNKELRNKLKPVAWGMANQLDNASHVVILLAKKNANYNSAFVREGLDKRGLSAEEMVGTLQMYEKFHKQDIAIYGNERALLDWTRKQCYIALANMMTGAAMIGIDSCPIEGMEFDGVEQVLATAGVLDAEEWGVAVVCTFGYRSQEISQKSRKSAEEVITFLE